MLSQVVYQPPCSLLRRNLSHTIPQAVASVSARVERHPPHVSFRVIHRAKDEMAPQQTGLVEQPPYCQMANGPLLKRAAVERLFFAVPSGSQASTAVI